MKDGSKIVLTVGALSVGLLTIWSMKRRKEKPNLYIRKTLPFGWNAMTIPPMGIFITEANQSNTELLRHELTHWGQYQKRGLVPYYFGYAIEAFKFGYDDMPMEVEARSNENEYCRTNYTQAVRDGDARTVYNPDFRK